MVQCFISFIPQDKDNMVRNIEIDYSANLYLMKCMPKYSNSHCNTL